MEATPGSRPPRKTEIADRADGRDGLSERGFQFAGVAKDGKDRPEGRRRQRDADDDRRPQRPNEQADEDADPEREEPPDGGVAARPPPEGREVELGPGDEEQHREPELRERREEFDRFDPGEN